MRYGSLSAALAAAVLAAGLPAGAVPRPAAAEMYVSEMPGQMARAYVRGIQEQLGAHGYRAGPVDGLVGPRTRAAIRTYQRDAGLPVTGRASKELLDHLNFARPQVTRDPAAPPDRPRHRSGRDQAPDGAAAEAVPVDPVERRPLPDPGPVEI